LNVGTGDRLNRHSPKLLDIEFTLRILDIACGRSHSVVAFDLGTLYVFGSNKFGQCGLHKDKKMSDILKPQKIELSSQDWAAQSSSKKTRIDIKQVVAGFTQTVLAVSCTRV
jgi:alpha-tubulin suppressor-like RCC1 family protein